MLTCDNHDNIEAICILVLQCFLVHLNFSYLPLCLAKLLNKMGYLYAEILCRKRIRSSVVWGQYLCWTKMINTELYIQVRRSKCLGTFVFFMVDLSEKKQLINSDDIGLHSDFVLLICSWSMWSMQCFMSQSSDHQFYC